MNQNELNANIVINDNLNPQPPVYQCIQCYVENGSGNYSYKWQLSKLTDKDKKFYNYTVSKTSDGSSLTITPTINITGEKVTCVSLVKCNVTDKSTGKTFFIQGSLTWTPVQEDTYHVPKWAIVFCIIAAGILLIAAIGLAFLATYSAAVTATVCDTAIVSINAAGLAGEVTTGTAVGESAFSSWMGQTIFTSASTSVVVGADITTIGELLEALRESSAFLWAIV